MFLVYTWCRFIFVSGRFPSLLLELNWKLPVASSFCERVRCVSVIGKQFRKMRCHECPLGNNSLSKMCLTFFSFLDLKKYITRALAFATRDIRQWHNYINNNMMFRPSPSLFCTRQHDYPPAPFYTTTSLRTKGYGCSVTINQRSLERFSFPVALRYRAVVFFVFVVAAFLRGTLSGSIVLSRAARGSNTCIAQAAATTTTTSSPTTNCSSRGNSTSLDDHISRLARKRT
jgi:hypothetical protein